MISTQFDRSGYIHTMSDRAYMFVLGFYVFFGLYLNILVSSVTYHWLRPSLLTLLIGIALPFVGIFISQSAQTWQKSSLGYLLVVAPLGVMLGPTLAMYNAASVLQALMVTMVVSGGVWLVGVAIPPITKDWSAFILAAVLLLMAGYMMPFVMLLFHMRPVFMGVLPWLGAILFSGLIVYDVNKAMQLPKTPLNAVKSAVSIYLDIYNLFLMLLQIFGRRDD